MKNEKVTIFRHEFKYTISYSEMLNLGKKMDGVMTIDHNKPYQVRSLYFDTIENDDYYDKLAGIKDRKKIRLRIYEPETDFVKLELKEKNDIHQYKQSIIINHKEAKEIIKGNYDILLKMNDDTANKLYLLLRTGIYKPSVIVEYTRLAYITNTSTRITFDYDIKEGIDYEHFFAKDINYIDVTNKNQVVLEVKFDRFLEPYLADILKHYITQNESVSKYVMARNKKEGIRE